MNLTLNTPTGPDVGINFWTAKEWSNADANVKLASRRPGARQRNDTEAIRTPISRPTRCTRALMMTTRGTTTMVTRASPRCETRDHPEITQMRTVNGVEPPRRHLRHLADHPMGTMEATGQTTATTSKTLKMTSRTRASPRAEMNIASPVAPLT